MLQCIARSRECWEAEAASLFGIGFCPTEVSAEFRSCGTETGERIFVADCDSAVNCCFRQLAENRSRRQVADAVQRDASAPATPQ